MDPTMKLEENGSPPSLANDDLTTIFFTSPKIVIKTGYPNNPHHEKSWTDKQEKHSATEKDLQRGKIQDRGDIIRVYKRRWLMLLLFLLYAFIGTFQWSMYAIIANIITKYYNVSNLAVNFTTMTYLVSFVATFLPASWILNNLGLRWSMVINCFLNALGSFLRVFSVASNRFWLTMIGQSIVGISQVSAIMIPTRMAAVWFPAHQVSFACAFAVNGILLGNALGFLAPPLLVRNSENHADIARDLNRLYIGLAISACISFLLTVAFFQDKPPMPPSQAQRLQWNKTDSIESPKEFYGSLKRLLTKRTFVTLLISYAFIQSVFCAIATLLNQVLIPHFPGQEEEVGVAGLILVVSGIASSTVCGLILDRTHAFKMITVALNLLTLAGWIIFAVLLRFGNMTLVYVSIAILGFATTGMQPVGLEFAVEITYPEPEATASGLMFAAVQLFGVLCTLIYGYMLTYWDDDLGNAAMAVPMVIGGCMSIFLRPKLKRQAAQQTKKPTEDILC